MHFDGLLKGHPHLHVGVTYMCHPERLAASIMKLAALQRRGSHTDEWVVDRTLFEYVNQGSCSCCGVSHAVMDVAQFLQMCSDMETDDGRREKHCPWPPFMREQLWRDMVGIRARLKLNLPVYQKFVAAEMDAFGLWWRGLSIEQRNSVFQMPVEEVKVLYEFNLNVKEAYRVVLCGVLEQVRRFRQTGYPPDGRTEWEIDFEDALETKCGAFVVHREYVASEEGLQSFFGRVREAGGAKLLARKASGSTKDGPEGTEDCWDATEDNVDGEAEHDGDTNSSAETVSFRGDRRLVRLVIFRYFLDRAIKRFHDAGKESTSHTALALTEPRI